jgi:hypothetical protein
MVGPRCQEANLEQSAARAACHHVHGLAMQLHLAEGGGSMEIIWMVLVTLMLALSGILGLALVTRIAAWARRRDPQPKP